MDEITVLCSLCTFWTICIGFIKGIKNGIKIRKYIKELQKRNVDREKKSFYRILIRMRTRGIVIYILLIIIAVLNTNLTYMEYYDLFTSIPLTLLTVVLTIIF